MSKLLKFIIITILALVLMLISSSVIATNSNLDLNDSSTDTMNNANVQDPTNSTTNNTDISQNTTDLNNTTADTNTTLDTPVSNDTNSSISSEPETTLPDNQETNEIETSGVSVSTSSTLPEEDLGLTNILNIFLIVLGVLLLLLGIAILTQIKKQ